MGHVYKKGKRFRDQRRVLSTDDERPAKQRRSFSRTETKSLLYPIDDPQFRTIVRSDYKSMLDTNRIAVTERVKELMLMQSIPGHAGSGHGCFYGRARYPNATIDDVYLALDCDPRELRSERQELLIDPIYSWVERVLHDPLDPELSHLVVDGEPLAGAEMFRHSVLRNPLDVLKGIYFGSTMDNYDWRKRVRDRFGMELGGGRCYAFDKEKMALLGESLETLSSREHTDDSIKTLIDAGVILDEDLVQPARNIINGYVRVKVGKGVSDDAAMITAGLKYGIEAAFGLLLVDAIDTWDKSTPVIHRFGQDEALGLLIQERCKEKGIDLGITPEKVEEFIYLSSIDPQRQTLYPDCSQRRFFLQGSSNEPSEQYAALLHLAFIKRKKDARPMTGLPKLLLGFAAVRSDDFYRAYETRYDCAHRGGLVSE